MINLGPLKLIPVVNMACRAKEGKLKYSRDRVGEYDPETSIYNSRSEHDVCKSILNWNKV